MKFISSLSDQRLLDAGGAADNLSRGDHEGGQVVGQVVGQAVTNEILARLEES